MNRLLLGAIGALVGLLLLTAWLLKGAHEKAAEQNTRIENLQEDLRHAAKVRNSDDKATLARVQTQARIHAQTTELLNAIPREIPADSCSLPGGWRRLHDRAATGEAPEAPSSAPAAPVEAQDASATVSINYGICRDTAEQLRQLQQWAIEVSE